MGIVIPRIVDSKEIHELYSPAHRRINFPMATWAHLIHAARNLAAAFATLHSKGVVLGDVNQGNVLVNERMLVSLIDCDSFQVLYQGHSFRCDVGVPHFTPPELQSIKNFRSIERTSTHDNFGLAVLIFHLIFMGRHPFAGRFSRPGEMTIERAIAEHRFVYGRNAAGLQMVSPPHSLQLRSIPTGLANCFERSFAAPSATHRRTEAHEWVRELDSLKQEIVRCTRDPGHNYLRGLAACPWCEIVEAGGPNFFVSVSIRLMAASQGNATDISALWLRIQTIPRPQPLQLAGIPGDIRFTGTPIPAIDSQEDVPSLMIRWIAYVTGPLCLLGLIVHFLSLFLVPVALTFGVWRLIMIADSPQRKLLRQRRQILLKKRQVLQQSEEEWTEQAAEFAAQFDDQLRRLYELKQLYDTTDSRCIQDLQNLKHHANQRQLEAFLRGHFISQHFGTIPHIGQGRVSILESYGIETAFDVVEERLSQLPGFGPTYTQSLMSWRRSIEASFRFDASMGVPSDQIQSVQLKYVQQRRQIEQHFRQGVEFLQRLSQDSHRHASCCQQLHQRPSYEAEQAKADLYECNGDQMLGEALLIVLFCLLVPLLVACIVLLSQSNSRTRIGGRPVPPDYRVRTDVHRHIYSVGEMVSNPPMVLPDELVELADDICLLTLSQCQPRLRFSRQLASGFVVRTPPSALASTHFISSVRAYSESGSNQGVSLRAGLLRAPLPLGPARAGLRGTLHIPNAGWSLDIDIGESDSLS